MPGTAPAAENVRVSDGKPLAVLGYPKSRKAHTDTQLSMCQQEDYIIIYIYIYYVYNYIYIYAFQTYGYNPTRLLHVTHNQRDITDIKHVGKT